MNTAEPVIVVRSLRHLDALVAEQVMGIKPPTRTGVVFTPPHYTTWPGLEPVVRNREEAGFRWDIGGPVAGEYWAELCPRDAVVSDADLPVFAGEHQDKSVAFCLAALASAGCRVRLELGEGT